MGRARTDSSITPNTQRPETAPFSPPQTARSRRLPPYAVVLLNDRDHSFRYMRDALQEICRHTPFRALLLVLRAHVTGRAVVWTGSLEVAELKREQLRSLGPDFWARKPVMFPLGCEIKALPE